MRKLGKMVALLATVAAVAWFGSVLGDRQQLRDSLIRLHVVANSDEAEDQQIKLQVRDTIIGNLGPKMEEIGDMEQAKVFLQDHLVEIEEIANQALRNAGSLDTAKVTLALEEFSTRVYDTFSLPAGVYESLRVVIGEGEGENWWCVVFPSLCLPATSDGFQDTAVSSGFSDTLSDTLTGEYEIRFYFLDCLGELENFFFSS